MRTFNLAFVASLLCSAPLLAQTFAGGNLGAIPDGGVAPAPNYGPPRDVVFAVSGTVGTVANASVSFSAAHTWVGDLRVTLIAPNGKEHLLFARTGATTATAVGSGGNLVAANTYRFGDAFAGNWWTAAVVAGDIPGGDSRSVLSGGAGVSNPPAVTVFSGSLAGMPANGNWILRFEDGLTADTGSVNAAALTLTMVGVTRTVTLGTDAGGNGNLRLTLAAAGPNDLVDFDPAIFSKPRIIELGSALPFQTRRLTLQGPGAHLLTIRRSDAAPSFRIFGFDSGLGNIVIDDVTINNGRVSGFGGGINSLSNLTLSGVHVVGNRAIDGGGVFLGIAGGTFLRSTFSGNSSSQRAGAIYYQGNSNERLLLATSTVSGNYSTLAPGGILNLGTSGNRSQLDLVSCTVARNTNTDVGNTTGGISTTASGVGSSAATSLRNTLIADNRFPSLAASIDSGASAGAAINSSLGFNLSNEWNGTPLLPSDLTEFAELGPLALQGGSTPSHLLVGDLNLLDKGHSSGSAVDQRGVARTFDVAAVANGGDGTDIGAVEMRPIVISNVNDSGVGSLRNAVTAANNNAGLDDIVFDPNVFGVTHIDLLSALPVLTGALTISGRSPVQADIRRTGADLFRIFDIAAGAEVALSGLGISNGDVGAASEGGGVRNQGSLVIADSAISGNHANGGGGIYSTGALRLLGSSVIGNSANFDGGGLYNFTTGPELGLTRMVNCTVSANTAGGDGAGIINVSTGGNAVLEIANSTIAENQAVGGTSGLRTVTFGTFGAFAITRMRNTLLGNNLPNNLSVQTIGLTSATFFSAGFNLSSDAAPTLLNQSSDLNNAYAGLEPLSNNGSLILSHALLAGSAALDAGNNDGSGYVSDQRGLPYRRPIDLPLANAVGGDGSDIGAYEATGAPVVQDGIFANGFQ